MGIARVIVRLGVAALVVAGCSGASSPTVQPSTAPATPAATTSAPAAAVDVTGQLPPGSYSATLPTGLEAAPGKWMMSITKDGILWTNPQNGATFSPGAVVEITSSTIVFAPDPGCPDQGATPTIGTYQWKIDQGQLVFTFVSDSCLGRRDTLTPAPWTPAS